MGWLYKREIMKKFERLSDIMRKTKNLFPFKQGEKIKFS